MKKRKSVKKKIVRKVAKKATSKRAKKSTKKKTSHVKKRAVKKITPREFKVVPTAVQNNVEEITSAPQLTQPVAQKRVIIPEASMLRNKFFYATVALTAILLFQVAGLVSAGWTAPTTLFPQGTPAEPLDTSSNAQLKKGALSVGSGDTSAIKIRDDGRVIQFLSGANMGQISFSSNGFSINKPILFQSALTINNDLILGESGNILMREGSLNKKISIGLQNDNGTKNLDKFTIFAATTTSNGTLDVNGTLCIKGDCRTSWANVIGTSAWQSTANPAPTGIYYNSGNVGIGTSTPEEIFQIGNDIMFHNGGHKVIAFGWSPATNKTIYKNTNSNGDSDSVPAEIRWIPYDGDAALSFGLATTTSGVGSTTAINTVLTLKQTGNVGIGTNNPQAMLQVGDGTNVGKIQIGNAGGNFEIVASSTNGDVFLQNNGTSRNIILNQSENPNENGVGIGVAPTQGVKLDVRGDIRLGALNNGTASFGIVFGKSDHDIAVVQEATCSSISGCNDSGNNLTITTNSWHGTASHLPNDIYDLNLTPQQNIFLTPHIACENTSNSGYFYEYTKFVGGTGVAARGIIVYSCVNDQDVYELRNYNGELRFLSSKNIFPLVLYQTGLAIPTMSNAVGDETGPLQVKYDPDTANSGANEGYYAVYAP